MVKDMTKQNKNPIIRKNKKWFNTLTKKYVSEAYAKRLNSYFKRNPKATLYRARGKGKYEREKILSGHSQEVKKLAYKRGSQIIKTKTREGKTVYYSPFQKEILSKYEMEKLKQIKFDYHICNKKAYVELFRLTRERDNIYHMITWNVNQRLSTVSQAELFKFRALKTFSCIKKELKHLTKKYSFSNMTILYGHISSYFYSDFDGWEKGTTFGFVIPNQSGFKILTSEFNNLLDWYIGKLEVDAYHNVVIQKITFYLYDSVRKSKPEYVSIAKYRIGINR